MYALQDVHCNGRSWTVLLEYDRSTHQTSKQGYTAEEMYKVKIVVNRVCNI